MSAATWRGLACAALVGLLLATPGPVRGAGLYHFVDDAGVPHYTNVPSDPRFRALPGWAEPGDGRGVRLAGQDADLAALVEGAAARHGLDPRLVEAVIRVESGGNPRAVSPRGAAGLMQLMPHRALLLGVRNPFDPAENVDAGARHLRDLLDRFGGALDLALAAYNAGEEAVRAHGGVPPYPETRQYVRRVRALYARFPARPQASAGARPEPVFAVRGEDGTTLFTNLPPDPPLLGSRF